MRDNSLLFLVTKSSQAIAEQCAAFQNNVMRTKQLFRKSSLILWRSSSLSPLFLATRLAKASTFHRSKLYSSFVLILTVASNKIGKQAFDTHDRNSRLCIGLSTGSLIMT